MNNRAQTSIFDEIIVDNFAGGGGASTGIELATGRVVSIVHIKTVDLCERCVYAFDRYCVEHGCFGCERLSDGICKCSEIRENTPCPDFKEAV